MGTIIFILFAFLLCSFLVVRLYIEIKRGQNWREQCLNVVAELAALRAEQAGFRTAKPSPKENILIAEDRSIIMTQDEYRGLYWEWRAILGLIGVDKFIGRDNHYALNWNIQIIFDLKESINKAALESASIFVQGKNLLELARWMTWISGKLEFLLHLKTQNWREQDPNFATLYRIIHRAADSFIEEQNKATFIKGQQQYAQSQTNKNAND